MRASRTAAPRSPSARHGRRCRSRRPPRLGPHSTGSRREGWPARARPSRRRRATPVRPSAPNAPRPRERSTRRADLASVRALPSPTADPRRTGGSSRRGRIACASSCGRRRRATSGRANRGVRGHPPRRRRRRPQRCSRGRSRPRRPTWCAAGLARRRSGGRTTRRRRGGASAGDRGRRRTPSTSGSDHRDDP